ncbi:MAG: 50S ribosomal protein L25/general stress protein Ctc [Burkholderiales bacterium]|nr:50S ribosomal protein L25/general stress protein Ctc [Burkholderiales bacterium]
MEVSAQRRTVQGTGASRRLRRKGLVPGVVYGGNGAPVSIQLDHKDLMQKLATEAFHASILTLDLDGAKEQVLLRAFSMHPYKPQVLHVDFQRVARDRKIHMKVPLHFVNADKAPGVKEQGGVVNHVLNELDVRCFPDDLPEYIEVDLSGLAVGRSVHVSDLKLPKGVEAVLRRGEDPVVATVIVPALASEEATAEAVPAAEVPTTEQAAPQKAPEAGAEKAEKKEKK